MSGGAPTPPGPGAAAVPRFLRVGVKPALGSGEQRGSGARARCRCHSWVIREINWGLGREAASKGPSALTCLRLQPGRMPKAGGMPQGGTQPFPSVHIDPAATAQQSLSWCPAPPILRKSKKKTKTKNEKSKLEAGSPPGKGAKGLHPAWTPQAQQHCESPRHDISLAPAQRCGCAAPCLSFPLPPPEPRPSRARGPRSTAGSAFQLQPEGTIIP